MFGYKTNELYQFADIEHFRRAILNERMLELVGEGHRWFDLVRMGLLLDVVPAATAYAKDTGNAATSNVDIPVRTPSAHHIFRPIPAREISIHEGKLKQNFGYN